MVSKRMIFIALAAILGSHMEAVAQPRVSAKAHRVVAKHHLKKKKTKRSRRAKVVVSTKAPIGEAHFSLNNVNTKVSLVLEQLRRQASVNLVMVGDGESKGAAAAGEPALGAGGPKTAGAEGGGSSSPLSRSITVRLHDVTFQQALDYVTAVAGLKYAKVQNTYVVGCGQEYDQALTALAARRDARATVRVVPIASGDGGQVQMALRKWFTPATLEVYTPADAAGKAAATKVDTGKGGDEGKGESKDATTKNVFEDYLILIGEQKWVDQGADMALQLDRNITIAKQQAIATGLQNESARQKNAVNLMANQHAAQLNNDPIVEETYVTVGTKAEKLKETIKKEPILGSLSIVASSDDSAKQVLILSGPKSLVERTLSVIKQLDSGSIESTIRETYMVRNGTAAHLKTQLVADSAAKDVTMVASSEEQPSQVIVLEGTRSKVQKLLDVAKQLDGDTPVERVTEIVGLKYIRPSFAKVQVMQAVPGLRATFAPLPVNPLVSTNYTETSDANLGSKGTGSGDGTNATTAAGSGSSSSGSGSSSSGSSSGSGGANGGPSSTAGTNLKTAVETSTSMIPMKLVLTGTKQQLKEAKDYLALVDVAPKQIAIELRVMELSKTDALNAGIDWSLITGGAVKLIRLNNSQATPSNTISAHLNGRNVAGDVTATLDKIATKSNLIARPNMLAMDGLESDVFIGDTVRYVQSVNSSQNGTTVITDSIKVGVDLQVVPRIGSTNEIAMSLFTRVSFLKGYTSVPGGGQLPQTSDRLAQNTISMSNGDTIAIGGLIQDQDRSTLSGIPILMNLPVLGGFFRKTTLTKDRTELVIFLTARAVENPLPSDGRTLPMQLDNSIKSKGAH